jgi:flagellar biosynthesis protein FliR
MVLAASLRAGSLWRTALGAAIAGLGTCAIAGYSWWSYRGDGPRLDGSAGVTIAILIMTAIGVAAGVISGRFRGAIASWAGALIGAALAYQANYAIDPSWPRSETPFEGWVVYAAVFLLPFIAGGHALGVAVANRLQRGAKARQT